MLARFSLDLGNNTFYNNIIVHKYFLLDSRAYSEIWFAQGIFLRGGGGVKYKNGNFCRFSLFSLDQRPSLTIDCPSVLSFVNYLERERVD